RAEFQPAGRWPARHARCAEAPMSSNRSPLLVVEQLSVHFTVRDRVVTAVRDVSFTIAEGETMGVVGESGSGKSVSAYSLVQLLAPNGRMEARRVEFAGQALLARRSAEAARGKDIAFIFQNPRAALNPIRTI